MRVYKIALSTVLLVGGFMQSQSLETRVSGVYESETIQSAFILAFEHPDTDKDHPGGDDRRAHRGSGRLESEQPQPITYQAHRGSGRLESEQPEPTTYQAHRGSGRLESEQPEPATYHAHRGTGRLDQEPSDDRKTALQQLIAQAGETEGLSQQAHRGSGRLEA
jgi:hypothetical protein